MKIAIFTRWRAIDNYGCLLQSYALQRYLRDLGHDAYVIRFLFKNKPSLKNRVKSIVRTSLFFFHLLPNMRIKLQNQRRLETWNTMRNFDSFRKKNINLSPQFYCSIKEFQKCPPDADMYITGSDQVWARDLTEPDNWAAFLDFGREDTKRISYAASFGFSYFPGKDVKKFRELLRRFDMISVREISGIDICINQGCNAVRCVDSTMLLSKEHYIELMSPRKHKEAYIYFYTVNIPTPETIYWNEMKSLFDGKNIKSVVTTGSGYTAAAEIFPGAIYDYSTVEEWLSNIYYADCVITASFHGIVFSILLQKNFIYMPLHGRIGSGNNRITDLLESSGLSERVANSFTEVKNLLNRHIDYQTINDKPLRQLIKESKEFLNTALVQ